MLSIVELVRILSTVTWHSRTAFSCLATEKLGLTRLDELADQLDDGRNQGDYGYRELDKSFAHSF